MQQQSSPREQGLFSPYTAACRWKHKVPPPNLPQTQWPGRNTPTGQHGIQLRLTCVERGDVITVAVAVVAGVCDGVVDDLNVGAGVAVVEASSSTSSHNAAYGLIKRLVCRCGRALVGTLIGCDIQGEPYIT